MTEKESAELATIKADLRHVLTDVGDIKRKMDSNFLTRIEFEAKFAPVQRLVFGLVAIILTTVVGAILMVVVKQ